MSERKDSDFLADIIEAAERIITYTADTDYDGFISDTQDAVIRNLEIIGEAAKSISQEFRNQHSDIPSRSMAGLRDRLIHDYFGVNIDIIWEIVSKELETVAVSLRDIGSEDVTQ
ncbi:MAG TPA: DUF86 domain-containing protein [Pyrinomonadaceae bacterium]|nr:DUF86 domain-containing protein [Pyrinomonadaceae bacterium]